MSVPKNGLFRHEKMHPAYQMHQSNDLQGFTNSIYFKSVKKLYYGRKEILRLSEDYLTRASTAALTESKPKPARTLSILAAILSLQRFPREPSWVWFNVPWYSKVP